MEKRPKKLLDRVREAIRIKHYSIRTEEAYVSWIKRYILFHHKHHPLQMGTLEIEAFLTHLATEQHVAASTQNQALNALVAPQAHMESVRLRVKDLSGAVGPQGREHDDDQIGRASCRERV